MSAIASGHGLTHAVLRSRSTVRRELPVWPVQLLFLGYPIWWLLGLASFAASGTAVLMAVVLLNRRQVRMPVGFGVWLAFIGVMLASVTQLDSALRVVGFMFRTLDYLSATVIFLYVYNVSRRKLSLTSAVNMICVFWLFVVIGGYLGVIAPNASFGTPFEQLLPHSIAANSYVGDLVHPKFAEVQMPWGAPHPFDRPCAPFAYTNTWGSHYALLLPFVLLRARSVRTRKMRLTLYALLAASLVPAFATLNRGMFLAVIVGICYAAMRFAGRGQVRWLIAAASMLVVGVTVALFSGVIDVVQTRTTYSSSTTGRLTLYQEALARTLRAPVLGYGGPRPSHFTNIAVGTQGQFWTVMFSFGLVGLALFCGWLWGLALRTYRAPTAELLWLHVVTAMGSFMILYYGLEGTQLVLIFVAGALVLREYRRHDEPLPVGALGGRP